MRWVPYAVALFTLVLGVVIGVFARDALEARTYVRTGAPISIRVVQDDEAGWVTECRLPAGIVLRQEGSSYDGVRSYMLHLVASRTAGALGNARWRDVTAVEGQWTSPVSSWALQESRSGCSRR